MMQFAVVFGRYGYAILGGFDGGQYKVWTTQTNKYTFQYIFKIDPF